MLIAAAITPIWKTQPGLGEENLKCIHSFSAMGVQLRIVAYVSHEVEFKEIKKKIETRVEQLESIFSDYRKDSEVTRLIESAPHRKPVPVSLEMYQVCKLSQKYYEMSSGAFDPTIGPLSQIWRFARKRNRIPNSDKVANAFARVGWKQVDLTLEGKGGLKSKSIQLDFGGIAKGFVADEIINLLAQNSITSALVDVGGDIRVGEAPPDSAGWSVAATSHPQPDLAQTMRVSNLGVATSGASEQRLIRNGKHYSHIIDPRTGKPVTHSINVTVIARNAAAADALASAFSVLGIEQSIKLADDWPVVFAMFVDLESGDVTFSQGYEKFIARK